MGKSVIIVSGGMDSVTLLYKLVKDVGRENVFVLTLNYRQRHAKEIEYARWNCEHLCVHHLVVDITSISPLLRGSALTDNMQIPDGNYADENMKVTVVPNRNMIFLSLAIAYAVSLGARKVYYGAHRGTKPVHTKMNAVSAAAICYVLLYIIPRLNLLLILFFSRS